MTEEWKHKLSDSKLKYEMKIFYFEHKMRTWQHGREICSKVFSIGDSKFQLVVYPNGNCRESKGNVSAFLVNKSVRDVKVNLEFDLGSRSKRAHSVTIIGFGRYGWETCDSHRDLEDDDMLDNGDVTATATISLLWEEVTSDCKNWKEEVSDLRLGQNILISDLKSKIETLETNMKSKIESLETKMISKLENPPTKKASLQCPECPICFNEMRPPTRIAQCRTGHLICQECRDRPEVKHCPICRMNFTGRAVGMETYLREQVMDVAKGDTPSIGSRVARFALMAAFCAACLYGVVGGLRMIGFL